MNVWQGTFPDHHTIDDGYYGTAPVDAYEPNAYGLRNMTGNVWEWCADGFTAPFRSGPAVDPLQGHAKVMRGGSYLCHASYCLRYRVSARLPNTVDSSSGNVGFRRAGGSSAPSRPLGAPTPPTSDSPPC